ncbi:MAG: hypothetical protein ACI8ZN_000365 [Bacteroidia bacterium]|jgi:hypothetical protein
MIEKFLKAKHWQLFLLALGLPTLFQFTLMGSLFFGMSGGNEPNPELMFNYFKYFPFIMVIYMGIFFSWFWSIAIGLDKKIPDALKLNLGRFKILLIIPFIYALFLSIFMETMMAGMMGTAGAPNPAIFRLIVPLHLFAMFCLLYCIHFIAKTIKTAELQKEVGFGDFALDFFLIWFFPIGIWLIQPKINKMVEE